MVRECGFDFDPDEERIVIDAIVMQKQLLLWLYAREDGTPYFTCPKRSMLIQILVRFDHLWAGCRQISDEDCVEDRRLGTLQRLQSLHTQLLLQCGHGEMCEEALHQSCMQAQYALTNEQVHELGTVLLGIGECVAQSFLGECNLACMRNYVTYV